MFNSLNFYLYRELQGSPDPKRYICPQRWQWPFVQRCAETRAVLILVALWSQGPSWSSHEIPLLWLLAKRQSLLFLFTLTLSTWLFLIICSFIRVLKKSVYIFRSPICELHVSDHPDHGPLADINVKNRILTVFMKLGLNIMSLEVAPS
jgi:hypothetical protein